MFDQPLVSVQPSVQQSVQPAGPPALKTRLQDLRLEEMAIREKILADLRLLNFGVRAAKVFCERELGYTDFETRAILIALGLVLTSDALIASDPVIRLKIEKLRHWRRERARAEGRAAYHVISNRTLMAVASQPINTEADLRQIKGLGEKKIKQFARDLLDLMKADA